MRTDVDAVVIGAGVVGLAVARALALRRMSTFILEKEPLFGSGISSRNSEVVHAGIYYARESLKARSCIRGRELLFEFCEIHHVPHHRCGKLIVATDTTQLAALETLRVNAEANGVRLEGLSRAEAQRLEPELRCVAALHSPLTAIVDSHALMAALLGAAEANGARLVCNTAVRRITRERHGWAISIEGEESPVLRARWVVNAAGLNAKFLATKIDGLPPPRPSYYAKGTYFALCGKCPFHRLIYPLPESGGLGIHLTLDLGGQARFGPDVEWVEQPDYTVSLAKRGHFAEAISRWWPGLDPELLLPGFVGIRPKQSRQEKGHSDFEINGPSQHGLPGLFNLFSIESPGLTASLALAEMIVAWT